MKHKKRPTFEEFKKEALKDPAVAKEYKQLEPEFELAKQLIQARQRKGLTQEEVAKCMHTQKSNIARLENIGVSIRPSPTFDTLTRYAEAVGCKLQIKLVPENVRHA